METYPIVVGGKSIQTPDHFEVRNPATGEVVGLAPTKINLQGPFAWPTAAGSFGVAHAMKSCTKCPGATSR